MTPRRLLQVVVPDVSKEPFAFIVRVVQENISALAAQSKEESSCSEKFVYADFAKNKMLILRHLHNSGLAHIPLAVGFC
jgi:hypothetical protein